MLSINILRTYLLTGSSPTPIPASSFHLLQIPNAFLHSTPHSVSLCVCVPLSLSVQPLSHKESPLSCSPPYPQLPAWCLAHNRYTENLCGIEKRLHSMDFVHSWKVVFKQCPVFKWSLLYRPGIYFQLYCLLWYPLQLCDVVMRAPSLHGRKLSLEELWILHIPESC